MLFFVNNKTQILLFLKANICQKNFFNNQAKKLRDISRSKFYSVRACINISLNLSMSILVITLQLNSPFSSFIKSL